MKKKFIIVVLVSFLVIFLAGTKSDVFSQTDRPCDVPGCDQDARAYCEDLCSPEGCMQAWKWGCWCQQPGWSWVCNCSYIIICNDWYTQPTQCQGWDWYCGWPGPY